MQIRPKCQLVRPTVTEQVIELLRLQKISNNICHSEQFLISKFQHGKFSWIMKYIWYWFVGYKMCQYLWILDNIVQYWTILAISINIRLILAMSNSFLCHLKALSRFYCFETFCLVTDLTLLSMGGGGFKVPTAFLNVCSSYRSVQKSPRFFYFSYISINKRFYQKFWKKIWGFPPF